MKEKKQTVTKTSTRKKTKSITSKKGDDATTKAKTSEKKIQNKTATKKTKPSTTKKKISTTLSKIIASLPFQVDSFIFYPNEGVGKITDIEERKFGDETVPYYVIKFISQKMISRIPTKNIKLLRIRKVISKSYVQKIWKTLEDISAISELPWKDRLLKHQEVLKKGNALETAEMLSSLYIREQERQLSFQERQYYEFAFNSLRDELSIALNIDITQAAHAIQNSLEKSQEKIKPHIDTTLSE